MHIPRGCGGEPMKKFYRLMIWQYSPRMRGWTMAIGSVYRHLIIFPADAGVNLNIPGSIIFAPDIPRRGGEKLILNALYDVNLRLS